MKKICLLYGGNSYEHEISIKSAYNIIKNIDIKKYNLTICKLDKDNNFYLMNNIECKNSLIINPIEFLKEFDKVFPMIHGNPGENGNLFGLLEMYNIPYVGASQLANAVCYNKYYTKEILKSNNIPQVEYEVLTSSDKIKTNLDYPVIIKPSSCGSSIGINIANNKKELITHVKEAFKYSNQVLLEKYIKKRELECAILESKNKLIISTTGEILPDDGFYDYDSKYEKETKLIIPSNIDKNIIRKIQEYSKKIFKILSLSTYSRLDFMYDYNNNKLYFNEVNTIPGFTDISMYPKLFEYMGISMKELITKLIEN